MFRWTCMVASVVALAATASTARAEGWLPLWNPFAASSAPSRPAPAGPTLWQRMTTGTQQTLSGAGQILNPWPTSSAPPPPKPSLTGSRRVYSSPASKPAKEKDLGWFGWLPWAYDDEEETPHFDSPADWIGQPRP